MSVDEKSINILGENIPARRDLIEIHKLLFLPDNPRVYAIIRNVENFSSLTEAEQQERIYNRLLKESSVKNLFPEIKRDGGLQEPIIVRNDTNQVVEGNSRLAVYRKLNSINPEDDRWQRILCLVVSTLTDEHQTRLLSQYHLHGKTDWTPYEKAQYWHRIIRDSEWEIKKLAEVTGFTESEIHKNVEAIDMMNKNNDREQSNFSYYIELFFRNRKISTAINERKDLKKTVLDQIKNGNKNEKKDRKHKALDMRKHLGAIIDKPRILKKYESGELDLEDAYDRAKVSDVQRKLKKICDEVADIEKDSLEKLERNELNSVKQIIRKTQNNLKRVSNMVEAELRRD